MLGHHGYGWPLLLFFTCFLLSLGEGAATSVLPLTPTPSSPPQLSGRHFKITVIEEVGYIYVNGSPKDGSLEFSGYLIDVLEELAYRANFTYELRTPSGFGSKCLPRLEDNATLPAYHPRYRQDYRCGESDVNDRPRSFYSTDFYWGVYYVTPERLQVNRYTLPYSPPSQATLGVMGTATHLNSISDLKDKASHYKVCAPAGTALIEMLQTTLSYLKPQGIDRDQDLHTLLHEGTCDVVVDAYPKLQRNVLELAKQNKCLANGKPIGVIGDPLEYGLNYFAFGLRMDIEDEVVQALNFWLQALMACFPDDPNGYCPNGKGSISQLYYHSRSGGARGDECGYVQYPLPPEGLHPGIVCAIAITPVVLVLAIGMMYHTHQLKLQEQRMKKRFVQQLARNIEIGPSSHLITAQKLSEAFEHIGGSDGNISKADLAQWMHDLNLEFLSEEDFDRLWETMDMDHTGGVDPIEFFVFLRDCEHQFQEVHAEYMELPKSEKVKLAARRLTNIRNMGSLEEVKKMERRNNKRSRQAVVFSPSKRNLLTQSSQRTNLGESSTMACSTTSTAYFADASSRQRFSDASRLSISQPFSGGGGLSKIREAGTPPSNGNNASPCNIPPSASQSNTPVTSTLPDTDSLSEDDDDALDPSPAAKEDQAETQAGDSAFFMEELEKNFIQDIHDQIETLDKLNIGDNPDASKGSTEESSPPLAEEIALRRLQSEHMETADRPTNDIETPPSLDEPTKESSWHGVEDSV